MKTYPTQLEGLFVVKNWPHVDSRGVFNRLYCEKELAEVVGPRRILQINHSRTATSGAIRGLHFQRPPNAEMKLVRCLKGRIWDVAVDLRENSSTFLRWHAEELTPDNARMMLIPEGFAHGFQVIESYSELLYLHTAFYTPSSEGGLRYDDSKLAINWPLVVTDISERDTNYSLIDSNFQGISL
jgi:dTDP-4-dehydrorhamnose 3,5-epimerase